jgi:putative glycosyltransferase (TIGR04372 family)
LLNLSKFKTTKSIFVNYYAFGHSVADVCNYFSANPRYSLCISIGNKRERNYEFKQLISSYNLIHFRLPTLPKSKNINLRKIVGPITINQLNSSALLSRLNKNEIQCSEFTKTIDNATSKNLSSRFSISKERSDEILSLAQGLYLKNENSNGASTQIYWQLSNLIELTYHKRFTNFEDMYLARIKRLANGLDSKICTLILRQDNYHKPHHGVGIDGYTEIIKLLNDQNFIINLIGDINFDNHKSIINSKKIKVLTNLNYNFNSKLFQLVAIKNSSFCLGDPSGAQALVGLFNKKNLIFNNIPVGQFHANSLILPRVWRDQNGKKATKEIITKELFYRIKPWVDKTGNTFTAHKNSKETLIKVTQNFLDCYEKKDKIVPSKTFLDFAKDSLLIDFAHSSDIAPQYFEQMD